STHYAPLTTFPLHLLPHSFPTRRSSDLDFYFPTEPRPLLVFIDGRVHLKTTQAAKDEELRTLPRKKGYKVLELYYDSYSDKKREDRKSTRLNSSHGSISYAVFCLKKKTT